MTNSGRRGSIRKDDSGKWFFIVDIERPGQKRRQVRRRGFTTKKAAQAALTDLLGDLAGGTYVEPSRLTVREFVETRWLPAIEDGLRPSTLHSYRRNMRIHVLPWIGDVRLQALDPATLQALYGQLRREGRADHRGGGGLSPRTVAYIHTIIRSALGTAVEWDLIQRNPAERTRPPRRGAGADRHLKIRTWTRDELRYFLDQTREQPLYPLWLLLATTGMRRGEALGLAWASVDLDAGQASIRRTLVDLTAAKYGRVPTFQDPKTIQGTRVVALDPVTVETLRDWKEEQAKECALHGRTPEYDLVFTHEDGRPRDPEHTSRTFDRRVRRLGLPLIRLHDLRHTWASLALQGGVHPKVVSERLGHSTITITLEIYSHVMPGMQSDAAELVADLILGDDDQGDEDGDDPAAGSATNSPRGPGPTAPGGTAVTNR